MAMSFSYDAMRCFSACHQRRPRAHRQNERLRGTFGSLGLSGVETILGSGNVIFETPARDKRALEGRIERRLSKALGRNVPVFMRSLPELKIVAVREPFCHLRTRQASVNVIFFSEGLERRSRAMLTTLRTRTDRFSVRPREVYRWRSKKPGTSLFATVPPGRVLRGPFTIRSRNTVRRLVAKWQ